MHNGKQWWIRAAILLAISTSLPAANIMRYDDRAVFNNDTSGRTITDFETLRTACISIPDAGGVTVNGVNFAGGVARATSSGPCAPGLTPWQGYVLHTRLVVRSDAPAQATTTATLPAGVTAVAFEVGINSDPVTSRIVVTLVTSDNKEQAFALAGKGTGSGGGRRVEPLFAGFTSSRAITAVRFGVPDIVDSSLILDNFVTAQAAPPAINTSGGVVNGASFLGTIAPNTWISIFGKLLSGATRLWGAEDFTGTRLPTSIEDVGVTINGRPCYVYYVSPGQVNVLTPVDLAEGPATVELTRGALKSAAAAAQVQRIAPGLFLFDPENRRYAAVTHADGTLVGKPSLYPGATTPARPGEVIVLWGTGFGRTTPDAPAGEVVSTPARLTVTPTVTIGGITADVQYAGLSGPGLYQVNVTVPSGVAEGDVPVVVQVEGARAQENVFITVQR